MADFYRSTDVHEAAVGLQLACDHVKQGGFARAVAAHNADAVSPEKIIGEIADDGPSVIGFADAMEFDDLPA